LPNLKVLIFDVFQQLFAPRRTTEKPIVGAQVDKINLDFSLKPIKSAILYLEKRFQKCLPTG
jgi:hypothetical protein